ncbi:glycosyltransferase family 2 protein [Shewanella xiamenensis]|uniref:glycosyltransferase family 2 protein n=1 Tax=Shewanella xiamenensis TaxID=332186 RepID=UPI00313B4860
MNKLNYPLITIITVVYNGDRYLEDTILSVTNQTYSNIEYIIVDGGSKDKTLDIIRKYESDIEFWVSEKDSGIYDAMNKGLGLAKGDYIIFMNADDTFFDNNVVHHLAKVVYESDETIDIIYGKTKVKDLNYDWVDGQEVSFSGLANYAICHQSAMVSRESYHKFNGFNLSYKICADYDFFVKLFKSDLVAKFLPFCISTIRVGGVSTTNIKQTIGEKLKIFETHYSGSTRLQYLAKVYFYLYPRLYFRDLLVRFNLIHYIRKFR